MSEGIKTLLYVGVACVAAAAAWASQPRRGEVRPPDQIGKMLFADFQDPAEAGQLEVVRFNEEIGELRDFEVARDKAGRWVIPSQDDYPADAEEQMKTAANALIDLEVLDIASELAGEHKLYGVVEPKRDQLSASSEGVGSLIRIADGKGKQLARLIIGKPVRGSETQRFVRIPEQDPVYVVNIDPEKFPTKFEDWIEKDLLKLNAFDIENVRLQDYSVVRTTRGFAYTPRVDIAAKFDNGNWTLEELKSFSQGKPVDDKLADDEELNSQALNDMKTALGDLTIVDVRPKPAGLTADLQAGDDFMKNDEAVDSLFQLGFIPAQMGDGPPEIRAANGEVHVGMKDGVQYVLRFGNIAGTGEGADADQLNRYLFVTTRLDESKIEKPELRELPPVNDQPAPETKGDAKTDAEEKDADKKDADKKDADKKDAEAAPDAAKQAEIDAELKAERERIEKENQRNQDEYEERLTEAKARVSELNNRFANWYYVISEDVYKKVHLGRDDLIQRSMDGAPGAPGKPEYGIDAFRTLESEGIEGGASAPPSGPLGLPPLGQ